MEKNNISNTFSEALTSEQIIWQAECLIGDAKRADITDQIKEIMTARLIGVLENVRQNPCATTLSSCKIALDIATDQLQAEANATIDDLTGLLNRAGIEKFSKAQFAEAKRHTKEIGIYFLDLDKFKPINDELGHESGDDALKLCSKMIKENVRRGDVISRYGGDEFVIIMLNEENHDWTIEYNKLTGLFDGQIVHKSDEGAEYPIGASIGFVIAGSEEIPAKAITRADVEMYKVKKGLPDANKDLGLEEAPLTVQIPLNLPQID